MRGLTEAHWRSGLDLGGFVRKLTADHDPPFLRPWFRAR